MTENSTPKLPPFRGAGETLKADELAGKAVTIVDTQTVGRRDGSTTQKWIIAHDDGTMGLYWAPSGTAPQQVQMWFRANPGLPLRVVVHREETDGGWPRWRLEQVPSLASPRPESATVLPSAPPEPPDVDEVPF